MSVFSQLSIVFAVTTMLAWVAKLLRQPLIVAYLIAGIVVGPIVFNLVRDGHELYETFAEFGVVFLLFVVGLSLNFSYIKRIGKIALIAGFGQAVFTVFFGWIVLKLLGLTLSSAFYIALAATFSSTIIVTKLLSDKKHNDSVYGRYTIGLMLVQDLIAIIIMILFSVKEMGGSLGSTLGLFALKIVAMIAIVAFTSRVLLPFVLNRIAHSAEFLFLFTVAWCFGCTAVLHLLGFSVETGALMAGLALGSSPFQAEIASRIKPLRDFFLILFFILLGSQLHLSALDDIIVPIIIFSVFVLIGNPLILYLIFRAVKFTRRNSFFIGLTAAQVSEFGFVLLFTGAKLGLVAEQDVALFTGVALVTICASSYLITYSEQLFNAFEPWFKRWSPERHAQAEDEPKRYDVWLIGAHRIGWRIAQALKDKGVTFAVVDFNPEIVADLKKQGIPAYFGDAADVEFLSELPLESAKLVISTIPDAHDQVTFIKHIRSRSKKAFLVANLAHTKYRELLYANGADYVMMPHVLGGGLIADLIRKKNLSKKVFTDLRREQDEDIKLGLYSLT